MNMLDRICEYAFGNERRRIRFLCMYVVLFLACLACTLYTAYQAMSCFPDKTFWTYAMFAVWFGILSVVTYVSLLTISECLTSAKERVWQEHGYE